MGISKSVTNNIFVIPMNIKNINPISPGGGRSAPIIFNQGKKTPFLNSYIS